ncbi:MAG: LysR substrate-binding domain-containing protein, partial [Aquincola tertiaricarbonis]
EVSLEGAVALSILLDPAVAPDRKSTPQNSSHQVPSRMPSWAGYRLRVLRAMDRAGRPWREAFGSHSLTGIQAAVAAGLGVSLLPTTAVLPSHRVLPPAPGFERPPGTELALVRGSAVARGGSMERHLQSLADHLVAQLGAQAGQASESRAGRWAARRHSV